ncbi:MAG: sulfatase-like hydrolase/transferase, partial [Verrucomicrobiota bacterium]
GQKAWKAGHRLNGKLLGVKFGAWEGGHRVPFIVRWPARIPAGTESDALISQIDLLPTFAAVSGGAVSEDAVIDGVNQLPELTGTAKEPARDTLIISPNSPKHLTVRKDKWVYIPARDEGGFQGRKVGDHLLAGAAAQPLTGLVNSDVVEGKIRGDAPPAQLYDLEADPYQARNIHDEHPEVVAELAKRLKTWRDRIPAGGRLGWINLNQGDGPPKKKRGKTKGAALKTPAGSSQRSASLDFESGQLEPWKVVEGEFGHIIGHRAGFFHNNGEYNKQGDFYLTTLEPSADAEKGMDLQTGVIVSPPFIPEGGKMTFRIGGGNGDSTYAALCTADGREVEFARGINEQVMQKAEWDLTPYAGKKMFIRVVDKSTSGWGHITVDDFQFDGKVLAEVSGGEKKSREAKPNFVVIFTDDQGYADVGCFGSPDIRTPRLDAMAAEGMKFTSFYAQPVCGPSRAAIMTGCYPMRVAERGNTKQVHPILHSKEITVAEILKTRGYATACFGKWDLAKHAQQGFFIDLFPTRQGFDYFFGTPTSNDAIVNLYRNEKLIEPKTAMAPLTQRYTDEAIDFMRKNQDKPFFVYIPHTMPHTRLDATPAFKGKSKRGLYGDVIEEIDFNVGRVLDAVKELDLAENTYVIFTSDNGPWHIKNKDHADGHLPGDHGGSAGPLRSAKVSTFEGGVRVPCIVWGPGRVPAGKVCDSIATTLDVLPTFAALAGAEAPSDRVIDGEDIRHLLHGEFDKADPDKAFYYYLRVHLQAVRQGKWKLHLPREKEPIGAAPFSVNRHIAPADRVGFAQPFLVDLEADLGETTDVSEGHPEVVNRLLALAESMREDLGDYDAGHGL